MREHAAVDYVDWKLLMKTNSGKLRKDMRESGVDCVILNSMDNIRWLTGVPMIIDPPCFHTQIAIQSVEAEEPILMTDVVDFFPEERTWLNDVRPLPFTKEIRQPMQAGPWAKEIAVAIRELGIADGKLAVDPAMSVLMAEQLSRELPNAHFEDASPILASARLIKSEEEVNALRQSSAVAERALGVGLESLAQGKLERQLAGVVAGALFEHGAEAVVYMPSIVSAVRPGILFSSGKTIRPNELVKFDASVWGGYCCNIARSAFTGRPTPEVMRAYEALLEAHLEGIKLARPGVTNWELYDSVNTKLQEKTDGAYKLPFYLGHGIGVGIIEEPWIFDREHTGEMTLEEGMTFLLEPSICISGFGCASITDSVLVTANGGESLTRTDRTLFLAQ